MDALLVLFDGFEHVDQHWNIWLVWIGLAAFTFLFILYLKQFTHSDIFIVWFPFFIILPGLYSLV